MEQYRSKREGMIEGFKPIVFAGVLLVVLFGWARAIVKRNQEEKEQK